MDGAFGNLWAQATNLGRDFTGAGLSSFTPLSRACQQHLGEVYALLAAGVVISCGGAWLQMNALPDIDPNLTGILAFAAMINILSGQKGKSRAEKLASFAFFAVLKGFTFGPWLSPLMHSRPDVVFTAGAGTLCVFTCFSLAAALAPRRKYLYLAGVLGSASTYFMLVGLCNMFFASALATEVTVYGWLLVFLGYVVVDTQVAVESFYNGNRDTVQHACQLYIDVLHIFLRLIDILIRKERKGRK